MRSIPVITAMQRPWLRQMRSSKRSSMLSGRPLTAISKLQEMGAEGNFYTQEQVRDILAYARDRGIRIVPEFDMPGHSTAWLVGYPELAAAQGPFQVDHKYGVLDGCMDPTKEEVSPTSHYTFDPFNIHDVDTGAENHKFGII